MFDGQYATYIIILGVFKENNTEDTQTRKEFGIQGADFLRKVVFLEKVKIKIKKTHKKCILVFFKV